MEKVLVAMSGGVDSSVAVWLLQQKGCECAGVNMQLYRSTDLGLACHKSCCSQRDAEDAADAAFSLGIPFETMDLQGLFRERVMNAFVRAYESGRTPNPCIDCNRHMKFAYLLDYALAQGYDALATGHYARITRGANGRWLLRKARDAGKDQSYVLYMLTQEQLAHLRLPLGEWSKSEIRAKAAALGLVTARKADSQDICFVPDGDYGAFLERFTGKTYPPGDFLDAAGRPVGQHRGAVRYTVGQRRGLGLPMGERVYVWRKDMARNTVTVGAESGLYSGGLIASQLNWIALEELREPLHCLVKTRYRQQEQPAVAEPMEGGLLRVRFERPQRAVTPGQAVVLYDGDTVLGGGTIREGIP